MSDLRSYLKWVLVVGMTLLLAGNVLAGGGETPPEQQQQYPVEQQFTQQTPQQDDNSGVLLLLGSAVLAGGAAVVWYSMRRSPVKQATSGAAKSTNGAQASAVSQPQPTLQQVQNADTVIGMKAAKPAVKRGERPCVFISYRRKPSAMLATFIARELEEQGIDVFVDTRKVDGAGPFPERLLHAIEDREVFVCLLADGSLTSDWVKREIEHAYKTGRPMIPVFQESYVPLLEVTEPYIAALLQNEGVHIFDVKNVYVDEGIQKLAGMIKATIAERR